MTSRLFEKGIFAMKDCRHGAFLYNTKDIFIAGALDHYGEWCESEIETLAPYIPTGGVVLDVGANIGTHALAFAQMVGPAGTVLAFEPQRLIYYNLCANAVLNAHENLHCFQMAVGDKLGRVRIPVKRMDVAFNFGCVAVLEGIGAGLPEPAEMVDCITIDALKLARCDVIKADVEGYEARVIRGAADTLRRLKPVLFVENNRPELSKEIYEALDAAGYVAFWHIAAYFSPKNFFGNKENIFERFVPEANVLCLHKDDVRIKDVKLPAVEGAEDTWERAHERSLAKSS